jgi:hypothetical protein
MSDVGNVHEHVFVNVAASATTAKTGAENGGISASCQMYPNTGGKTITTVAAHTA